MKTQREKQQSKEKNKRKQYLDQSWEITDIDEISNLTRPQKLTSFSGSL